MTRYNLPKDSTPLHVDCHLGFDAIHVDIQDMIYDKSTCQFLGMARDILDLRTSISKQMDKSAFLISIRSNPFSRFRFPLAIIGMSGESSKNIIKGLFPIVKNISEYVQRLGGKIHFIVCDHAQAHHKVYFHVT